MVQSPALPGSPRSQRRRTLIASTSAAALDAITLSAHCAATPQLTAVVHANAYADWSDRELVKLAAALGSVGGLKARDAIATMQCAADGAAMSPASSRSLPAMSRR